MTGFVLQGHTGVCGAIGAGEGDTAGVLSAVESPVERGPGGGP